MSEAIGERHFMAVRFTPTGARLFLGVPLSLIANRAVEVEHLDPKLKALLLNRVGTARDWGDRFQAMELLIAERLAGAPASGPIGWAWNRLAATRGAIPMSSLAAEIACSHRHLIAQFREQVGLPPKTVAQVFRFNRALELLNGPRLGRRDERAGKPYIETPFAAGTRAEVVQWADIAAQCGFFDQPHFIKEFRRFAGATPGEFLRQTLDVT